MAQYCIQCADASGVVGSYAFEGETFPPPASRQLSPTYADTLDLYRWLDANGWAVRGWTFDLVRVA